MYPDFSGQRVTVIGLGVEGVDLVRFLGTRGAQVTVSEARPESALAAARAAIADVPGVTIAAGGNREEHTAGADAVYVSQGVPHDLPPVRAARRRGVPISSMTRLFFELCPAPIAGITGSSGKTTTTALVGAMLDVAAVPHAVGGNIGVGMLSLLDRITPDTRVVLELSHTQLESLDVSPHLACITNVTPNHLDRYGWGEYVALKRRIFTFQRSDDLTILHADDPVSMSFARYLPGHAAYTALTVPLPGDGVALAGGTIVRRTGQRTSTVLSRDVIRLRGEHNVANVLSAIAVASPLGVSDEAAARAVQAFTGVPHRLEPVARTGGVEWINDSIATTPERTLAGLRAFTEPMVLLLGGRDKLLPTAELAREAAGRCRAVVTFGEAGDLYATALRRVSATLSIERVQTVEEAVAAAALVARAGDVVLFSPAGTSFDAYPNFEARGRAFREAVRRLAPLREEAP